MSPTSLTMGTVPVSPCPPDPGSALPLHARGLRGHRAPGAPPIQSRSLAAVPWLSLNLHCDTGGTPCSFRGVHSPWTPPGECRSQGRFVAMSLSLACPSHAAPAGTLGLGGCQHPWLSEGSMGGTPLWRGDRHVAVPATPTSMLPVLIHDHASPGWSRETRGMRLVWSPRPGVVLRRGVAPSGAFHALYSGSFFSVRYLKRRVCIIFSYDVAFAICHCLGSAFPKG